MLQIFLSLAALAITSFLIIILGERYADRLSDKSAFKKWWRNNIIAPEPKIKNKK